MSATTPISTFLRSTTSTAVTISDVIHERALNVDELKSKIDNLHPIVQQSVSSSRKRIREAESRGALPNFYESDFVLVARDDFTAGEKLSLRWSGSRRFIKVINDYVFQVEDFRNGQLEDVHCTMLKFYKNSSLDVESVMYHVVSSETGMPVQRLISLVGTDDGLMVHVRWHGLPEGEDTLEPLQKVFKDVSQLLQKLPMRKNSPAELVTEARRQLRL